MKNEKDGGIQLIDIFISCTAYIAQFWNCVVIVLRRPKSTFLVGYFKEIKEHAEKPSKHKESVVEHCAAFNICQGEYHYGNIIGEAAD